MNAIKHSISTAALAALGAFVALAALAGPANARWYEGNRYDNGWRGNDHYNGYYYREPPVVYGTPYNNGYYYPPPVIYNNTPGFTIRLN
jgi:hypothetical protein